MVSSMGGGKGGYGHNGIERALAEKAVHVLVKISLKWGGVLGG